MDNTGINKIHSYDDQIDFYNKQMSLAIRTYTEMLDLMAQDERVIREACIKVMRETYEAKKMAIEKIELEAASQDEDLQETYLRLVENRQKEKGLRKIIKGITQGLSSVQSKMKYDIATNYGGVDV